MYIFKLHILNNTPVDPASSKEHPDADEPNLSLLLPAFIIVVVFILLPLIARNSFQKLTRKEFLVLALKSVFFLGILAELLGCQPTKPQTPAKKEAPPKPKEEKETKEAEEKQVTEEISLERLNEIESGFKECNSDLDP